jgi:hypothetical protein
MKYSYGRYTYFFFSLLHQGINSVAVNPFEQAIPNFGGTCGPHCVPGMTWCFSKTSYGICWKTPQCAVPRVVPEGQICQNNQLENINQPEINNSIISSAGKNSSVWRAYCKPLRYRKINWGQYVGKHSNGLMALQDSDCHYRRNFPNEDVRVQLIYLHVIHHPFFEILGIVLCKKTIQYRIWKNPSESAEIQLHTV